MKLISDLAFTTESAEQKVLTSSEVKGVLSTSPLNMPEYIWINSRTMALHFSLPTLIVLKGQFTQSKLFQILFTLVFLKILYDYIFLKKKKICWEKSHWFCVHRIKVSGDQCCLVTNFIQNVFVNVA